MANQLNINSNSNKVTLKDVNPQIIVRDNNKNTSVTITPIVTEIVEVNRPGARGAIGIQGITGIQGIQGIIGPSGGVQGIQGTQGIIGPQGIQGTQGIIGTQGIQGTQGIIGTQGTSNTIVTDDVTNAQRRVIFVTSQPGGSATQANLGQGEEDENTLTYNPFTDTTYTGNLTASGEIIGLSIIATGSLSTSPDIKDLFLIKFDDGNGQPEKFSVSSSGVVKFAALSTLPSVITGSMVYSASNFYMGL